MTMFEVISTVIFWIIIGVFICHKASWYERTGWQAGGLCIVTLMFAPIIFIWDIFNRVFVQKWHDE